MIPYTVTDTTGGAFPRGSVRFRNLGEADSAVFELVVSASEQPAYYSSLVAVEYWNPISSAATQSLFTSSGFACLGFGLRPSVCASGSGLHTSTARCADGTPTTMSAAEYRFDYVLAGTATPMAPKTPVIWIAHREATTKLNMPMQVVSVVKKTGMPVEPTACTMASSLGTPSRRKSR